MAEPTKDAIDTIFAQYNGLYSRFQTKTSPDQPLLLAHYTSVETVERILRDEELWFSNPLYMNDLEEMRAGIGMTAQTWCWSADLHAPRRLVFIPGSSARLRSMGFGPNRSMWGGH